MSSGICAKPATWATCPCDRNRSAIPRWSSTSIVRECRPPARDPARSWLARRSTMATSTPANASSPANMSPVGPPPTMTTACSVMAARRSASRRSQPAHHSVGRRGDGVELGGDQLGRAAPSLRPDAMSNSVVPPIRASSSAVQRSSRPLLDLAEVLGVAHLLAPLDFGALDGRLPDREVSHEMIRGGAVPVPFPRRCVHRVARAHLEHVAAARLDAPNAFGHVEGLAGCMDMPGIPSAGCEADDVDPDARGWLSMRDLVDPDVASELLERALARRLLMQHLHGS